MVSVSVSGRLGWAISQFNSFGSSSNSPKSAQKRLESLCAGLRVPCRILWASFGPALCPSLVRTRRFPAGSLKVFGSLLAQPSLVPLNRSPDLISVDLCSMFQAGASGNGPGPKFGRKPTPNRPTLKVFGALLAQSRRAVSTLQKIDPRVAAVGGSGRTPPRNPSENVRGRRPIASV